MICCAPKRALKPAYPPGSCGSTSGWPLAQMVEFCAQWMAKPTKSVCAFARAAVPASAAFDATASLNCGDGLPKTLVMSPVGPVPVFSSTMLAVAIAPTSQPARVNATHGAGTLLPSGPTMLKTVGVPAAETGSVQ